MIEDDMNVELRRSWRQRKRLCISKREIFGASFILFPELEIENPCSYTNITRMSSRNFEELLELIKDNVQKQNIVMRTAVPAKFKL